MDRLKGIRRASARLALGLLLIIAVGYWAGAGVVDAQRPFPEPPDSLILANEFIEIAVNVSDENTGRFAVNTTGGDPLRGEDDYKPLVYSSPLAGPWSSYTTVRVDGVDYVFGGRTGMRSGRAGRYGEPVDLPHLDGGTIRTVWQLGDVRATQELSIADSITTGFPDTAKITYRLRNTGSIPRRVGLRIMLDTLLGENDGAPFRVGEEAITTDRLFEGDRIPQFVQAFDSLSDPRVMSQATLRGDDATVPDAVYFANWGALADGVWEFDFQPGRDFLRAGEFELDSAIALYWYPVSLEPGAELVYTTYYGLGGITIVAGDLSLGLTSPARVSGHHAETVTFPVIAYIENTGEGTARDVEAVLELPSGLHLAGDQRQARSVGHLAVGDTAQVSWTVSVAPGASGDFTYRVRVHSSTADTNEAQRTVHVVAPAVLQLELTGPTELHVVDDRWEPVPVRLEGAITNTGGITAHGVVATLMTPIGLTPAAGDWVEKPVGPIEPGETVRVPWYLVPTGIAGADLPSSMRVSAVNARVGPSPSHFIRVPTLDSRIVITAEGGSPDRPLRVGDFVIVRIEAVNLQDLQEVALTLRYNPAVLQVLGGRLGVERGTLFVTGEGDGLTAPQSMRRLNWAEPQVEPDSGIVRIAGDMGDAGPLARATGVVASVRFRAVGPGESPLVLEPHSDWIFRGVGVPLEVLAVNHEGAPVHLIQGHGRVVVSSGRPGAGSRQEGD